MNEHVRPETVVRAPVRQTFIDCDIHPTPESEAALARFMPAEWREYNARYANFGRLPITGMDMYPGIEPHIARRDSYPPTGGLPGSDLVFMREQHLDPNGVEIGILQPLSHSGGNQKNPQFSAVLASAINQWQLEDWTSHEPRLRASLMMPWDNAEASVKEIARHGKNPAFAQVGMNMRTTEPLGSHRYWPIYRMATEYGMPVGVHAGGSAGGPPLGGAGWASYHIQQHQAGHIGMSHMLLSFALSGVFEEIPDFRLIVVEGGFTWLPALMWRADSIWEKNRGDFPMLKRPPSEYVREHVWISSQPMDVYKTPAHLKQVIDWLGWDRLCFATDYPHWDFDDPQHAFPFALTPDQKQAVFHDNARAALRL